MPPRSFLYNNNTPAYSGAIYNLAGGLFNLRTDQYLYGYLGQEFVNNAGTVQKLGGTGTSTFYGVPLTNSGTVTAQQGTLYFQSGFVQGSSATLASVLGGAAPGSGYGQIQFANPLVLAGALRCQHTQRLPAKSDRHLPRADLSVVHEHFCLPYRA